MVEVDRALWALSRVPRPMARWSLQTCKETPQPLQAIREALNSYA